MSIAANIILPESGAELPVSTECAGKSSTDNCAIEPVSANNIIAELNRVKCVFQLRTICAVMGAK